MKKILMIMALACSVFAGNFQKASDTVKVTDEVVMPRESATVYYGSGYYYTHRCTNPNCREFRPVEPQKKVKVRRYTIVRKRED